MHPTNNITQKTVIFRRWRLVFYLIIGMGLFGTSSGCRWRSQQLTQKGMSQVQNNQLWPAIDTFQRALNTDPRSADANYNLGATYYYLAKETGQPHYNPKAEDFLRKSLIINPNHVNGYRTLSALMVETNRKNEAFQLLRSWQVAQPSNPEPLVELARLYKEHNETNQSVQHLADALKLNPNHSRALVAMGQLREQQGHLELAMKNYQRSFQTNQSQVGLSDQINRLAARMNTSTGTGNPNTRYASPNLGLNIR